MNEQAHRIYANTDIGNRVAQFPKTRTLSGIGALAAVSGGLFQGRARSPHSVIEQLSRIASRRTFANAA